MNVLVIAPHPDDEILGAGGTIAKRALNGDEVYVCVVTKGCEPLFSEESVRQVRSECKNADEFLGVKETIFMDFPAAMLETVPRYKLNDEIVKVVQKVKPDEVYIPHRGNH
jgi:LmbE family N-acetylglucosaminyl deacetylase